MWIPPQSGCDCSEEVRQEPPGAVATEHGRCEIALQSLQSDFGAPIIDSW